MKKTIASLVLASMIPFAATPAQAAAKACPALKAVWIQGTDDAESLKTAFETLSKRLEVPVTMSTFDMRMLYPSKKLESEFAEVLAKSPDYIVFTVSKKAQLGNGPRWLDLFNKLKAIGSKPSILVCSDEQTLLRGPCQGLVDATAISGVDYLPTGKLEPAAIPDKVADILFDRTYSRLIPVNPKLSEIDPKTGLVEILYTGRLPKGQDAYVLEAAVDGIWRTESKIVPGKRAQLSLGEIPPGPHTLYLRLGDTTLKNRKAIREDKYPVRMKATVSYKTGRKLNNLVTELFAGPLENRVYDFINPRDGYVFIGLEGCGDGAEARVDGATKPAVHKRPLEPLWTMRWLSAGRHTVAVSGVAGGKLAIRAVKAIRIRDTLSDERPSDFAHYSYGTDFHRLFIRPYANIITPASVGKDFIERHSEGLAYFVSHGYRLSPGVGLHPHGMVRLDQNDIEKAISSSDAWKLGFEVAIDENRVDMEHLNHGNTAEAIWHLASPAQSISMFWAGCGGANRFRHTEVLASEISAIVNSGEGKGLNFFETYQRSNRNEDDVEKQFDDTLACIRSMVDLVPAAKESAICYFGTYYFPMGYTPLTSPYADHRVLLDRWVKRLATAPQVSDLIAGIGSGSYHWTDEEMPRWVTALLKHYAIDGRTDSLADRYGYRYNPGFVANPDFDDGLEGWTAKPAASDTITPLKIENFGLRVQGRKDANGAGDGLACLKRTANGANRLSQKISGLTPGRHYALAFYSADYDEYLNLEKKGTPKGRMRLRVEFNGGRNVPALESHHFGPPYRNKPGILRRCRHRLVFRADAPEITMTILDRADGEGEKVDTDIGLRQIINFVHLHEYFLGDMSIEEIVALAENRWRPRAK